VELCDEDVVVLTIATLVEVVVLVDVVMGLIVEDVLELEVINVIMGIFVKLILITGDQ
jgi:hypothetical protein